MDRVREAEVSETDAGLWRNRAFRRLYVAQAVSGLGDIVFEITVVLWVATIIAKGRPWAPLAVVGVVVAATIPVAIVGPIGGVFADRWDRRRLMMAMDVLRAALIGSLIAVPVFGRGWPVATQLSIVYTIVILASCAAQFFNPARFGLMGVVVADRNRERAGSLAQGTTSLASIIGPPLAAPLLFTVGVQWALLANAASFLWSFAFIAVTRPPAAAASPPKDAGAKVPASPDPTGVRRQLTAGLKFLLANPTLRVILISAMVVMLGVGSLNALDVFFVIRNLHASPSSYGLIGAAFGAGSILGAVLGAVFGGRLGATRVYTYGLILAGVGVTAFARMDNIGAGAAALFVAGIPIAAVNAMIGPLVYRATPSQMIGRIIGILTPAVQIASLASMVIAGWLASTLLRNLDTTVAGLHLGTIDTIFLAGGVLMILAGLWAAVALRAAVPAAVTSDPSTGDQPVEDPITGTGTIPTQPDPAAPVSGTVTP